MSTTEIELRFDFADCPDLAQTVLVCAAALGKNVVFTGVETLKNQRNRSTECPFTRITENRNQNRRPQQSLLPKCIRITIP
jgi:hypothetical protein